MARWLAGAAIVLLLTIGLAWVFRLELILAGVRFAMDRRVPTGPNQPIEWASGPDPHGRGPDERPPNVVVILADDLGWNDLTFAGGGVAGGSVPTPHIDSLARDGASFTWGYAANGTCAPSRAAIMSGRYGTRFGFEFTPTPAGMGTVIGIAAGEMPGRLRHGIPSDAESVPYDEMGMPISS